jgi:hypothetical protein
MGYVAVGCNDLICLMKGRQLSCHPDSPMFLFPVPYHFAREKPVV